MGNTLQSHLVGAAYRLMRDGPPVNPVLVRARHIISPVRLFIPDP